jgi:hypothetical protein
MVFSIPLPKVPLRIRKGAMSGWEPMYGSGPREVGCAQCGSSGLGEGCGPHTVSPALSGVLQLVGLVDGDAVTVLSGKRICQIVRCVYCGRLSSHISWRRAEFLVLRVPRC